MKNKISETENSISETEKQKYREKVQLYTSYQIGQKLNDSRLYTQQDIESSNLQLKSSAMMRVLTKWCEEL